MRTNNIQAEELEIIVLKDVGYVLKNLSLLPKKEIYQRLSGLYQTIKLFED